MSEAKPSCGCPPVHRRTSQDVQDCQNARDAKIREYEMEDAANQAEIQREIANAQRKMMEYYGVKRKQRKYQKIIDDLCEESDKSTDRMNRQIGRVWQKYTDNHG